MQRKIRIDFIRFHNWLYFHFLSVCTCFFISVYGRVRTDFDPTPIMSTYLVAFIVSDYEYREFNGTNEYETVSRVFASADDANQTSYALIEGIEMLNALENYFQIPFSLPALDQAVVPEFRVGGMQFISNKIRCCRLLKFI